MRTPVKYGVILAMLHLVLSGCIVLLARVDVENLMLFLAIDYPVTILLDLHPWGQWLYESLSLPGDGGVTGIVVLGTLFYAAVGACLGLVVSRWRRNRLQPPGTCRECGYDLTGNESGVCPECGMAIGVKN